MKNTIFTCFSIDYSCIYIKFFIGLAGGVNNHRLRHNSGNY